MPVLLLGSPGQRDRIIKYFTPNEDTTFRSACVILAAWAFVAMAVWDVAKPLVFPSLEDIVAALPELWLQGGLGQQLISSLTVSVEALILSSALALPLAYISRTPIFRPVAHSVAKLRFISPAVFYTIFLYIAHTGHGVKLYMLTFGGAVFLVSTMIGVVQALPDDLFDDARTLRMSEWQATWYVAVRGTLPQALDAIRDNAAMSWSMLMMIEGVVRSEGGVGLMTINQEKFLNYAEIYAIAFTIILVGVVQDYLIGQLKQVMCPYAD